VFGIEPNNHVIHQAVVMQQAAKRQGNHAVKNRSAVRGGGAKPWRQKGTGRARQGSIRSPQWVGGGVVFGPTTERNYKQTLPKKVRRLALQSALSSKVKTEDIIVLNDLQFDVPKTKEFVQVLDALKVEEKALVVTTERNEKAIRLVNNPSYVKVITFDRINVLEFVAFGKFIFTKESASKTGQIL